jgi:pyruvate/2-oxoglutarate dehydrogenase complex dihydrolipoamide acyltransferase (E2) component
MIHTVNIIMRKLGLTMQEGTIASWLKQDGELVAAGEVLGIIETEKLTNDLEAQQTGRLRIVAAEGSTFV